MEPDKGGTTRIPMIFKQQRSINDEESQKKIRVRK
jgi:hypothetical protein